MTVLTMTALVGAGAFVAGLLGALTGLGGGIIIVPLLTLAFGVDIKYAVGASLVSVIATSSGAAASYVKEGYTNIRVGMLLEVATTVGALVGAYIALRISPNIVGIVFAVVLLFTAVQSFLPTEEHVPETTSPLSRRLRLGSNYPTSHGMQHYEVQNVAAGFGLMLLAGTLSALLGIGSGVVKVLAMDRAMRLPLKVSTTTSNFMIGVTAATSAGVYLKEGRIDPVLALPVMLGVLLGARVGARALGKSPTSVLRVLFSAVVVVLAAEMLYKGITGSFR